MKKSRYYCFFILCAVLTGTLFSCTNEEDTNSYPSGFDGLQTDVEFLRLTDNSTDVAGTLEIMSNAPEVTLKWNTAPSCNLDTLQTTITLKNGRGVLPVKWQKKLEEGTRGPKELAYKAGVQITAGEYSKYVPLVWAEEVDSVKLAESSVKTRATDQGIMPRVAEIEMLPSTVQLNDQNGGVMKVTLSDISFAILDLSEFTAEMNLDLTNIPNYITTSQILNFRWKAGGAPAFAFSARVVAMSEGLVKYGYVNYAPPVDPGTLNFVNSNLPAGNIPQPGGTYRFTFDGTYTGTIQLRCLINGVVAATGGAATNKTPSVSVPQNTTTNKRSVTFQYKRENGEWINLPVGTNKTQDELGAGIVVGGIKWASGNLVKVGNIYKLYDRQEQYSGVWNGGDYWKWNNLDPYSWQNTGLSYSWNTANDPCRQVAPAGTWRTPTSNELTALMQSPNSWGYLNGVGGRYFGYNNELFLPAAGYRPKKQSITGAGSIGFYWASSQRAAGGNVYILGFESGRINVDYNAHRANSSQIRCVSTR